MVARSVSAMALLSAGKKSGETTFSSWTEGEPISSMYLAVSMAGAVAEKLVSDIMW